MFDNRVKELVLSTLVADSYCLGSHWIYDETQLKSINIDWNNLNKACSIWHKGKNAGEFTHYGDQAYFLYEYCKDNDSFDIDDYLSFWKSKMDIYNGYIDGATRDTLKNIEDGKTVPCGSNSSDLSIVGRIAPLLLVSKTKDEFLKNVELFVVATHNSPITIEASRFFALLLLEVLEGCDLIASIGFIKDKFSTVIQNYINEGLSSISQESFDVIRAFGPACGTNEGFPGVIHILAKYEDFKEALVNNAKAGGDNSARAMIIAMLLVAKNGLSKVPREWTNIKVQV